MRNSHMSYLGVGGVREWFALLILFLGKFPMFWKSHCCAAHRGLSWLLPPGPNNMRAATRGARLWCEGLVVCVLRRDECGRVVTGFIIWLTGVSRLLSGRIICKWTYTSELFILFSHYAFCRKWNHCGEGGICNVRNNEVLVSFKCINCGIVWLDSLCGLVVRVPGCRIEMYCVSCEVRTEFMYVM
jgi:hypothetical protein